MYLSNDRMASPATRPGQRAVPHTRRCLALFNSSIESQTKRNRIAAVPFLNFSESYLANGSSLDERASVLLAPGQHSARDDDVSLRIAVHDVDVKRLISRQGNADARVEMRLPVRRRRNIAVRSATADVGVRRDVATRTRANRPRQLLSVWAAAKVNRDGVVAGIHWCDGNRSGQPRCRLAGRCEIRLP